MRIDKIGIDGDAQLGDFGAHQRAPPSKLLTANGTYAFPLDIFQTGSATSTNMNANEVIANRATQMLGPSAKPVHPNNDVNIGNSSNDVIPAAIHVSAYIETSETLLPSLRHLHATLKKREGELGNIIKTGRTHLMDAMPIKLGQLQIFDAYEEIARRFTCVRLRR